MLNTLLLYRSIEYPLVVLSTIVPWLVNVPPVVPLPRYLYPDSVPLPPLVSVKLPNKVPPLQVKLLVLTPEVLTPFRVPLLKVRLGVVTPTLKLAVPPETVKDAGLIVPDDGVKFADPYDIVTPPVKP